MFKNKQEEKITAAALSNSSNIIGKGTIFEGNVQTFGNLRVEGKIIGNIKSKSKVAVGQSSVIEGNILAQVAEIEGEVHGSVEVTDILILKPTCNIKGDITANKLIVESGAVFKGKCNMGVANKKIEIAQKEVGKNASGDFNQQKGKPMMKAQ